MKGVLIILVLGLFLVGGVSAGSPGSENLVSLYHMEGDASDFVGNNHGLVNGATLVSSKPGFGQAYSFEIIEEEYISVSDATGDFDFGTGDFSISLWVKTSQMVEIGEWPMIVFKVEDGNGFEFFFGDGSLEWDGTVLFKVLDSNNISQVGDFSNNLVYKYNDGLWHHYVGIKSGNTVELFIDGISQGPTTGNIAPVSNNYPLRIGNGNRWRWSDFEGEIDEVAIWNRALTFQEITDLSNLGSSLNCGTNPICDANLVALYQMEGDASDSFGNNDGTVNGANLVSSMSGFGQAYNFEIVQGEEHINVPDDDSLDFGINDFSIGLWAKTSQELINNFWPEMIYKGGGFEFYFGDDNYPHVYFKTDSESTDVTRNSISSSLNDGQWHYYVGVRNSTGVELFVDGNSQGVTSGSAVNVNNNNPVRIGSPDMYRWGDYEGEIDEIAIWNRSLTAQEIRDIYNSGTPIIYRENSYTILKTNSPPAIDGNLIEFTNANPITITNSVGNSATYKMLWDNNALYIATIGNDDELASVVNTRDGSGIWGDDSIELFFDTLNNGGTSLNSDDYKFFVNLLNTTYDYYNGGGGASWNTAFFSAVTTAGTLNSPGDSDIGYTIEVAIPWTDWVTPSENDDWGFDVNINDRRDDTTRIWKAWSQTTGLNKPDEFGEVIFSSEYVVRASSCTSGADTDFDNIVSIGELLTYISSWKSGSVSIGELLTAISEWKSGC